MLNVRCLKLILILAAALGCLPYNLKASAALDEDVSGITSVPPTPDGPFSPSNSRTQDGNYIPVEQFFPSKRCGTCHKDTHSAWSESLHRNAAREPFYRESADILLRARGVEFTRHCESCHNPIALFSGALTKENWKGQLPFTELDDEGVNCSVCHSITEARADGTGSFTIRRPALLAREDGVPIYGDISDEQILSDIASHKRAVMRPLLKKPEFCATCHKSDAPPSLNGYKHLRGFSAYDEWQQSGASQEAVVPFYKRAQRADCRACHMPRVESKDDRAAKDGRIASHRWIGANTAAPLFYGQTKQVELVEEFLKSNVLGVDIFAIRGASALTAVAPLEPETTLTLNPGEEVTVEVVVSNRNAAHSFPPELRDLYEAWVEFEAIDANGKTLFHSGFLKSDKVLDEAAHTYKAILIDESGRQITRHQVWLIATKAYDNAIPAGRSDVVRFRFHLPEELKGRESNAITLRARVNYRRFIQEYTEYVLNRQKKHLPIPVVRMAEAQVKLILNEAPAISHSHSDGDGNASPAPRVLTSARQARRWNDYGIGLLEQAQYGAASLAFRQASELDQTNVSLLVNAAIAEMKTERFGPEREQIQKARHLLERAQEIDPNDSRTAFYFALLLRSEGKAEAAVEILRKIAEEYPRDREVQRQFGQTSYRIGQFSSARIAFESLIVIDPQDAGAYQFLAPIYEGEARKEDADRARYLYLQWRDDPRASMIAAKFYAAHPQWADERVWSHTHGNNSALRPVLSGTSASPDH